MLLAYDCNSKSYSKINVFNPCGLSCLFYAIVKVGYVHEVINNLAIEQ